MMPLKDEIRMNLVADHTDIMLLRELCDTPELFLAPYPSDRVVRGAEQYRFRVSELTVKIVEINLPMSIVVSQRRYDRNALVREYG